MVKLEMTWWMKYELPLNSGHTLCRNLLSSTKQRPEIINLNSHSTLPAFRKHTSPESVRIFHQPLTLTRPRPNADGIQRKSFILIEIYHDRHALTNASVLRRWLSETQCRGREVIVGVWFRDRLVRRKSVFDPSRWSNMLFIIFPRSFVACSERFQTWVRSF